MSVEGELAERVLAGDRRSIARAITLFESRRADEVILAERLLAELYPRSGRALRVGVTGPPGAGKSTLIDALGAELIARARKVGVLAIDPTSETRGGSLLGDRLRMTRLSTLDASFVRASPSSGAAGGLGRRTREALVVLDAAGFDPILVESVGTGQGELAITEAVDVLVAVLLSGAGDDIQGMKRGLFEHADLVVFNKADGENLARAERARDELAQVFAFVRPGYGSVSCVSALEGRGVAELGAAIERRHDDLRNSGELLRRRGEQRRRWFARAIAEQVLERQSSDEDAERARSALESAVENGDIAPPLAARRVLAEAAQPSSRSTSGGA